MTEPGLCTLAELKAGLGDLRVELGARSDLATRALDARLHDLARFVATDWVCIGKPELFISLSATTRRERVEAAAQIDHRFRLANKIAAVMTASGVDTAPTDSVHLVSPLLRDMAARAPTLVPAMVAALPEIRAMLDRGGLALRLLEVPAINWLLCMLDFAHVGAPVCTEALAGCLDSRVQLDSERASS